MHQLKVLSYSKQKIMYTETRPWGSFVVLGNYPDCKIKRLIVSPQKRLSLQSHRFRNEMWVVLHGRGKAIIDGEEIVLQPGKIVTIRVGQTHRLFNDHDLDDLEVIEVQTGSYFGEDDITRYQDDFGRVAEFTDGREAS